MIRDHLEHLGLSIASISWVPATPVAAGALVVTLTDGSSIVGDDFAMLLYNARVKVWARKAVS